jgi:hypothetical protein
VTLTDTDKNVEILYLQEPGGVIHLHTGSRTSSLTSWETCRSGYGSSSTTAAPTIPRATSR